jgi:hypothetical protein
MQENKNDNMFDINSIMSDVEKVIQQGLNKLLVNYIERHEMLEKTHKQLIQLPSIVEELNKRNLIQTEKNYINDSESDIKKYCSSQIITIKDMKENNLHNQVSSLETKLCKIEKKYDAIIPILDKLLDKISHLNDNIKEIQNNNEDVVYKKSSFVKFCENENIGIHIEEEEQKTQELEQEFSDDDEDVNPLFVTCSTILLKEEQKTQEVELEEEVEDQHLSVDGIDNYQETGAALAMADTESKEEVIEESSDEEAESKEEVIEESSDEEASIEAENKEVIEESSDEEASIETESKEVIEESSDEEASIETESKEVIEESSDEEASNETESKEVIEESVNEEASVETETKEEDEEEIFEIDIDDKTYCTNNDENGFIWELTEDGEQGDKVGYFKEGEPFFYAEEN